MALGVALFLGTCALVMQYATAEVYFFQQQPVTTMAQDTTRQDSLRRADSLANLPYQKSRQPTFQPVDRYGDPFRFRQSRSPLLLQNPSGLTLKGQIDTAMNYSLFETIGDVNYRPTALMSFEEFNQLQTQQAMHDYFQEKSQGLDGESAVSGRNLIPKLYASPAFDRIFGGTEVELKPSGFVNLDFGFRYQRVDNPALTNQAQRQGGFEFDLGINMNVVGSVGQKLKITTNFDNQRTFDFENNFRVEYTGFEEEIIKKIEIGNVGLPLNNTLITGSQNLFGIKSQWQFGDLYVTGVASTQRSTQEQICIEGGVQGRQYELRGSDYDENRHFFLSHFFRDNYEKWLSNLPTVTSSVNVNNVVVYVLNRSQETASLRNVAAFMDLGEGNSKNIGLNEAGSPVFPLLNGGGNIPADNDANALFDLIQNGTRDPNAINGELENMGMTRTVDFEKITGARRLDPNEYTVNRQLGYISLFRKLQNDEMLAVAYSYSYNGQNFQVGEMPQNYSDRQDDDVIIMKLLRPTRINTRVPTWDLMMKNIYNLGASQLARDNFQLRIIYRDDLTGQDQPHLQEGIATKDVPLVRIFGMDRLNINGDSPPDGNFDYVDGLTVNSTYGYVIFPTLEPFGRTLRSKFDAEREQLLAEKFVYDTLYRTTRADAELVTALNKFYIKGSYQAAGGGNNEIMLSAIALTEGTVTVTAGGLPLQEGSQYQVDAFTGRVRILDESIMASGKEICISFEKDDLFNFQRKNLVGLRADYKVSDDINLGATLLHLREQSRFTRTEIGLEPVANTNWGLDFSMREDSRFLTRMVDFLPLIQTKEVSTVNLQAEFAQLRSATSNIVDDEGTSYIDDFEEASTPFNLATAPQVNWTLAATPDDGGSFRYAASGAPTEALGSNYRRAKMAWYSVDNLFYQNGNPKPRHLEDIDLDNHYVRQVNSIEIFPGRDQLFFESNWPVFDIAYYPYERGPYNYNPDLDNRGFLRNPEDNWGGITRAITTENDFDAVNIEYIEFWMLDPFIRDEFGRVEDDVFDDYNTTGGKLIFHLGNISEDVIPDGRHAFENGVPVAANDNNFSQNDYGIVTTDQWLNTAFDNSEGGQTAQDVGLDGVGDAAEQGLDAVTNFLNQIPGSIRAQVEQDPAADNYQYFLNEGYDTEEASILRRYKNYNGLEGNTPSNPVEGRGYTELGNTQLPDNEDINRDNTLSDLEQYYEYELDLRPGLEVGENYIVDKVVARPNGLPEDVTWYLFRVPIRKPDRAINGIEGFKSIRYMRMVMTGWEQPVVLRMGKFQIVGSKWRRSLENLDELGFGDLPEEEDPDFLTSVVSVSENRQGGPDRVSYILPEGFQRDRDINSPVPRELNEQSLSICVNDLKDGNTRAVYKNVNLDLVNYGRVKMFLHAESPDAVDDELYGFIRMGTDVTDNYYEVEVPLKITPYGDYGDDDGDLVWPEANNIDISLDSLYQLKAERNRQGLPATLPYPQVPRVFQGSENQLVTVKGNPDISSVQVLMIGIRNRSGDGLPRSVCIWANEMRVTDFDTNNGWAANVRMSTKLADLADITTSGRYTTAGYGTIQQKIYERTRDESWQFDVSANVNLHKFFPNEWGVRLPMFVSYERARSTPFFDPGDPDTPLDAALRAISDEGDRADYLQAVTADNTRRSVNFTNVGKNRTNLERVPLPFDFSNFTFSYAFSEQIRDDFNTFDYTRRRYAGGVIYNYSPPALKLEPFKDIEFLNHPYLELIRTVNFNFAPSNILVQGDLERQFTRTILRKSDLKGNFEDPYFEKFFTFNRRYSTRWSLTEALTLDYNAQVNALIDEPEGDINTQVKQDSILTNIQNLGRMKNFNQTVRAQYSIPFNKFPLTDWVNTDISYDVGYIWTAGSFDQIDSLGNVMENSRSISLTGRLDFNKLYNKVEYFKKVMAPPRQNRRPLPDSLQPSAFEEFAGKVVRTGLMVKSINFTYNTQERTMLPGFRPQPFMLGLDSTFTAPGWEFLLGSQNDDIKWQAVQNGWLVLSPILTQPFVQARTENITFRGTIEPLPDLRINLNADRRKTDGFQEIFRYDTTAGDFRSLTPSRTGNYSISMITLQTAFTPRDTAGATELFNNMSAYRDIFRQRLQDASNGAGEFRENSQDVLVNSFLAAILDSDPTSSEFRSFPSIPLPNWRIDYSGLSKLDFMKDIFSSFTISHGYTSTFTVANYNNTLDYTDNLSPSNPVENFTVPTAVDDQGRFVPRYIYDQVVMSEKFSPLIGINFRTKNKLTFKIDYKRQRDISLNVANSQVTDMFSQDISMDIGFIKSGLRLPIRIQGAPTILKNDVNFRMGLSLRDSQTVQRKFDEEPQPTAGMLNFQTRPTVTYSVNEKFQMLFYFEHSRNIPRTNQSFPRTTTAFGVQLRLNLAQ